MRNWFVFFISKCIVHSAISIVSSLRVVFHPCTESGAVCFVPLFSVRRGCILMHLTCVSLLCHFSGAHHSLCVDHRYDIPFRLLCAVKYCCYTYYILLMLSCACYSFNLVVVVLIHWLLRLCWTFNVNILASLHSFYCIASLLQASANGQVCVCSFYIPIFE